MTENLSTIKRQVHDGILTVTLSRPDSLNAFTVDMANELEATFREVNEIDEISSVVVTGEGTAFCAGMDLTSTGNVFGLDESKNPRLEDMDNLASPELRQIRDTGGRVTLAIYACRKPVIAAINGAAVGIGATMTLAMDARLASRSARIGLVFGRLGIVPEAASSWFLPRIVGLPAALDLVYSAETLDATSAADIGLVDVLHADEELMEGANALVRRWTANRSLVATALARQMIYRNSARANPADAHRIDSLAMFYTSIGDGAEGIEAFREKRTPQFSSSAAHDMPPFYEDWIDGNSAY